MIVDGRAPAFEQGILRLGLRIGTEAVTPGQWELLLSLLPEAEAHKVQGFYHDKDRRLALGSLLLQRAATSWVLGPRFKDILIQRTQPHNKPYVEAAGTRIPGWNYNVSHQGDWVVLASEPSGTVGTDIVCLRDRPFQAMTASQYIELFRRHLTPAEQDGLAGLAPKGEAAQYGAFYRVWAMKEAYIKAVGLGLSFPIRRLECSILDVGEDFMRRVGKEGEEEELMMDGYGMADWKLRFLALPPDGCYLWCTAVGPAPSPLFQAVGGRGGTAALGMSTVGGDCYPCNGCYSTIPFSAAASQDAGVSTAAAAAAAAAAAVAAAAAAAAAAALQQLWHRRRTMLKRDYGDSITCLAFGRFCPCRFKLRGMPQEEEEEEVVVWKQQRQQQQQQRYPRRTKIGKCSIQHVNKC
eukprot:evm.model.NODE_932_length_14269_cov_36.301212.2